MFASKFFLYFFVCFVARGQFYFNFIYFHLLPLLSIFFFVDVAELLVIGVPAYFSAYICLSQTLPQRLSPLMIPFPFPFAQDSHQTIAIRTFSPHRHIFFPFPVARGFLLYSQFPIPRLCCGCGYNGSTTTTDHSVRFSVHKEVANINALVQKRRFLSTWLTLTLVVRAVMCKRFHT